MAFNNNALTARLDELRSRNPPRIPSESNTGPSTPFRYSGSYMSNNPPQLPPSSGTETPSLQRRFTMDMSKMPIAPIGELNQNTEPLDVPAIVSYSGYFQARTISHLCPQNMANPHLCPENMANPTTCSHSFVTLRS